MSRKRVQNVELIERVRAGDQQAAAELFRRYEHARRSVVARWRGNRHHGVGMVAHELLGTAPEL